MGIHRLLVGQGTIQRGFLRRGAYGCTYEVVASGLSREVNFSAMMQSETRCKVPLSQSLQMVALPLLGGLETAALRGLRGSTYEVVAYGLSREASFQTMVKALEGWARPSLSQQMGTPQLLGNRTTAPAPMALPMCTSVAAVYGPRMGPDL